MKVSSDGPYVTTLSYMAKDKDCFLEGCIYGHKCPRGRQCSFREQGRCKFVGNGMHNE